MASSNRTNTTDPWERRIEFEPVDVDELAELQSVCEDEIVVSVGEANVGGVEGVGELDVKSMVGPEIRTGETWHDADDL